MVVGMGRQKKKTQEAENLGGGSVAKGSAGAEVEFDKVHFNNPLMEDPEQEEFESEQTSPMVEGPDKEAFESEQTSPTVECRTRAEKQKGTDSGAQVTAPKSSARKTAVSWSLP